MSRDEGEAHARYLAAMDRADEATVRKLARYWYIAAESWKRTALESDEAFRDLLGTVRPELDGQDNNEPRRGVT